MKNSQFEEIVMLLSIIIMILAYMAGFKWLYYTFLLKSIFDFFCLFVAVYKEVKNDTKNISSKNYGDDGIGLTPEQINKLL